MNRETKRMMKRQGQIDDQGAPAATPAEARRTPSPKPPGQRTTPGQYVRDVQDELRKVAWPTREETVSFSSIVSVGLVVLTALIFALNFVLQKGAAFLMK